MRSYMPLGAGNLVSSPPDALSRVREKYPQKTIAQVILRWHLQHGMIIFLTIIYQERHKRGFYFLIKWCRFCFMICA